MKKLLITNVYTKAVIGALVLTLLYGLTNLIFGQIEEFDHYVWGILSNFLVALLLGYYIVHSSYERVKLMAVVFLIYFLIGHFNLLIEAYIFNVTNRLQSVFEIVRGFIIALVFCPFYVYIFQDKTKIHPVKFMGRTFLGWFWRIAVADVLYLFFYLLAGFSLTLLYPEIMQFYEGKIPPFDVMILTQLFLRGVVFIAIALLMLRSLNLSKHKKAVLIGLVFAVIGGIAPLIPPNELMPGYVRLGHAVEVGVSNFLYGMVLSYLLGQKQAIASKNFEGQNE